MLFSTITLNVNGIHDPKKWSAVWNSVLSTNLKVIFLQETHLTPDQEYIFARTAPGFNIYHSFGSSNSTGILTAIKRNCGLQVNYVEAKDGCFLHCLVVWEEEIYNLINIYAPNDLSERSVFFSFVDTKLWAQNILLAHDFNSVIDPLDRITKKLDNMSLLLKDILERKSLDEPKGKRQFMYQHPSMSNRKSRIDHWYLSMHLLHSCFLSMKFCQVSDHQAVLIIPC